MLLNILFYFVYFIFQAEKDEQAAKDAAAAALVKPEPIDYGLASAGDWNEPVIEQPASSWADDRSLYVMNTGNHYDLKKLQFTIQQLVSASPCRSTDGIFYTGS